MLRFNRVQTCLCVVWLSATFLAIPALAQQRIMVQDSTLNNLVHPEGYMTCPPGTLGGVLEIGTGAQNVVLISGLGFGAEAWRPFMERNKDKYHFFAVTLAGFDGTPAPPMPPAETSYGEQTWTRGASDALAKLIKERNLESPLLIGHFLNGTQVALRVALDHPELVGAVMLLSGSAHFEPLKDSPYWPRGMSLERRTKMVDLGLAPQWFKTVTRETWNSNNFQPIDYALDSSLGRQLFDMSNSCPLPVMVRYLCEFHVSDIASEMKNLAIPTALIQPGFTQEFLADTTHSYMPAFFQECWKGIAEGNSLIEEIVLDSTMAFPMYDQPETVDSLIASFIRRNLRQ